MTDTPPPVHPESVSGEVTLGIPDGSAHHLPARTPKISRGALVIAQMVLMVAGLCLCTGGVTLAAFWNYNRTEQTRVAHVIEQFMGAMEAQDLDAAYALFSPFSRSHATQDHLEILLAVDNFALFDDFQAVTVERFELGLLDSPSLDMDRFVTATVEGQVKYAGNLTGQYQANVELVGDAWMLVTIHVTIPPETALP